MAHPYTPDGFGRSKLAAKFDRGIGVVNSARNWNTVLKLMGVRPANRVAARTACTHTVGRPGINLWLGGAGRAWEFC